MVVDLNALIMWVGISAALIVISGLSYSVFLKKQGKKYDEKPEA